MTRSFIFKLLSEGNGTVTGELLYSSNHSLPAETYDSDGAAYYILAVIFMYGCSILMMIASFVKKSSPENSGVKYMKDLQSLEKLQLQQEKFRTKLQMHQKKVHRILGPDRAEVLNERGSRSPSPTGSPTDAAFVWDLEGQGEHKEWEDRRPSGSSVATTIVCSDDLHSADLPYYRNWMPGFEENGFLSAPNSPTVPRKEFPESSASHESEEAEAETTRDPLLPRREQQQHKQHKQHQQHQHQHASRSEHLSHKLAISKSQSFCDIEDSVSITRSHGIPEVRIHTCE
jgi:hypothetical protein